MESAIEWHRTAIRYVYSFELMTPDTRREDDGMGRNARGGNG